jgi:prepilin-type N-terminal cleavage/methylation domain-containing protein
MNIQRIFQKKGVTLIELLVALTILGIVIGAVYRLFIAQTKAYTVQDQVAEVQQNVRGAMEILLRDLRMTGFDDDSTPGVTIPTPISPPAQEGDITVSYEHLAQAVTVRYWSDAPTSTLKRQVTTNPPNSQTTDDLLGNVNAFTITYGIDTDDPLDGIVNNWVTWNNVGGSKIIAVQVTLTARPDQTNTDVKAMVSPRTLTSAVMFRNVTMK